MMGITRKRRSGLVLVFAVSLVLAQAAVALGAKPGSQASQTDGNDYYVVTFKDKPVVTYDGGVRNYRATTPERGQGFDAHSPQSEAYADYLRGVHGEYVRWLQQRAPEVEVVRDLVLASNAVALRLNGADPGLLSRGPGVKYTAKSDLYRPTMESSVELIGAPDAWAALGSREGAGAGVKVGVIDTGIDDSHPFINSCREDLPVSHQYFVSGDTGMAPLAKFGTPPDEALVFDHGTHVAGTIGGCVVDDALDGILDVSGDPLTGTEMSGVAPGVELHDYNVFPGFGAGYVAYGGSAFSHDIGAAIEQALADGMDVINMSLGGGVQGPHDWLAEVVNDASTSAVFAVSAGNEGSGGEDDYGTVGSPGSAAGALTVGASTNSRSIGFPVKVTDGNDVVSEYPAAVGDFDPFAASPVTDADFVLWPDQADVDGDGELEGLACTGTGSDLTDQVVLIDRGTCAFSQKVANAKAAGAAGVVVANNVPGDGPIAMAASAGFDDDLPAVGISYESGQAIRGLDDPWTVTIDGNFLEMSPTEPNRIAAFSSRGPAPFTWLAKPDIVAPGVNIRSSVFEGLYAQFQGTSMAAPHVAGAAALVIDALGGSASPKQVKGMIVAAADRGAVPDGLSVLDRGNGLLDVATAIGQGAWADPVSVSFGVFTGGKSVSGAVPIELHGSACDVTIEGDDEGWLDYAGGVVTMNAGRADSGEYEGDLEVSCTEGDFTVPWWFEIDRRGN